jgi:hypothetical protein
VERKFGRYLLFTHTRSQSILTANVSTETLGSVIVCLLELLLILFLCLDELLALLLKRLAVTT